MANEVQAALEKIRQQKTGDSNDVQSALNEIRARRSQPVEAQKTRNIIPEGIDPALKAQLEKRGETDKLAELEKGAAKATTARQLPGALREEFVDRIVRGVARPFFETKGAIQEIVPGGKTGLEPLDLGPFGELKPSVSVEATRQGVAESPGELVKEALGVSDLLAFGTAPRAISALGEGLKTGLSKVFKPISPVVDLLKKAGDIKVPFTGSKVSQFGEEVIDPLVKQRATNIAIKEAAEAELRASAPEVRKAVGQGIDIKDANRLSILKEKPALASKAKELLERSKKVSKGLKTEDPTLTIGRTMLNKFKRIEDAKNKVGKKLGDFASQIPDERLQDTQIFILNRLKAVPGLDGIEMRLSPKGFSLDFTNTTLSRNKAAQKEIISQFRDGVKRKAKGKHLLRQELFEELKLKDAKKLKQVQTVGDRATQAIRQGLSDVLDAANTQYKALNQRFATLEGSLKSTRRVLGRSIDASDNVKSAKLAQIVRRTTSNAAADAQAVLEDLERALRLLNIDDGIDLVELQEILNILDKVFDISKETGLPNIIEAATAKVAQKIPFSLTGAVSKGVQFGAEKTIGPVGITQATKQQAIEELIKTLTSKKPVADLLTP